MSQIEDIGALVRSVPVAEQTNDPDITVVSLDLHEKAFVVRCEIGGSRGLLLDGLTAADLRDSLGTRYERAGEGEDFIAYTPAIPAEAEWLKVGTSPETHIDLVKSN
jgi:hypothetical protein